MSDDIEAIKDALEQWVEAMNARRADILMTLFSDEVVFVQPPAGPFVGKMAVGRLYRAVFHAYDIREQLQYEDIRIIGTRATARVTRHVQLTPRAGGEVVSLKETDALRFRREADGAWKLVSRSPTALSPTASPFASLARGSRGPSTSKSV
ncbi:MAG TPA: SgcJ/EcaC family oxidoreductase [Vicinamibacterales bacterium]|jgi:uncharacterized protein (TIGR02246 family)|nr:SgcJ/EcaC family oxidoreductase [Vicinamibacterales bacterium]